MSDLTPETLAEWRKDCERLEWAVSKAGPRILALLDALAAEKAAREEAVRKFEQQVEFRREYERMAEKAEQERDDMERELRKSVRLEGERALASAAAKAQVAELEAGIGRQDRRLRSLSDSPLAGRCVTCGHVKHNDLGYCQTGQCSCDDGTTVGRLASILMRDLRSLTEKGEGSAPDAWVDRHGDVWTLGDDGLMYTPETAPFPREHVEKKWGPLRPVEKEASDG